MQAATLTADEGERLLALARETLRRRLEDGASASGTEFELSDALRRHCGAFVSVYVSEELRGCRGEIIATRPLHDAVRDEVVQSALHDVRFAPVMASELPRVRLSISVLTPLVRIPGPDAIEIGRHGVVLEKGDHRAVFLPQVAPRAGWDVPTMLSRLARKAGLSADDWRSGTRFWVFEAQIIEEPGVPETP